MILGFAAFAASNFNAVSATLYGFGVGAYVFIGVAAWQIAKNRAYQVVDAADRWWPSHKLSDIEYVREQMMSDLATAAAYNRSLLDAKGKPLTRLMVGIAAEAVLVAAAIIASLV